MPRWVKALLMGALALLSPAALASPNFVANSGVSMSKEEVELGSGGKHFKERKQSFTRSEQVVFFRSESDEANDLIVGAVYFPPIVAFRFPPTAWMAFYSKAERADGDVEEIGDDGEADGESRKGNGNGNGNGGQGGWGGNKYRIRPGEASSFVSTAYTTLQEVGEDGSVVRTLRMKDRNWAGSSVETSGDLSYVTYNSTDDGFVISLTFVVSNVLGRLEGTNATVTPRNMESFYEIDGYPYADAGNHLVMTAFLGHISSSSNSKAHTDTQTVIAGSGASQVYFRMSEQALVDGVLVNVTVTGLDNTDVSPRELNNPVLAGQLQGHKKYSPEVRKVQVAFPAGADHISYDPTMGFAAPDSAALLSPSSLLLALLALLALYQQL